MLSTIIHSWMLTAPLHKTSRTHRFFFSEECFSFSFGARPPGPRSGMEREKKRRDEKTFWRRWSNSVSNEALFSFLFAPSSFHFVSPHENPNVSDGKQVVCLKLFFRYFNVLFDLIPHRIYGDDDSMMMNMRMCVNVKISFVCRVSFRQHVLSFGCLAFQVKFGLSENTKIAHYVANVTCWNNLKLFM